MHIACRHCTLYNVQCTLYIVHCTLYTVHITRCGIINYMLTMQTTKEQVYNQIPAYTNEHKWYYNIKLRL